MAPRKRISPLEDVCFPVVYTLIQNIILNHHIKKIGNETQLIDDLKMVVNNLPLPMHEKIAEIHLWAIMKIFGKGRYLNGEEDNRFCVCEFDGSDDSDDPDARCVCVNEDEVYFDLSMKVISLLKIKHLDLNEDTTPLYILNKLISQLDNWTNLEVFSINDYWKVDSGLLRRQLLKTAASWSNLTSFICQQYCNDEILALVCKNCELLREVHVNHCIDLKNPIEPLVTCKNLEIVNLEFNGYGPKYFLKMLLESASTNLIEIRGLDDRLYDTIDELEEMKCLRTFYLKHFKAFNFKKLNEKYLRSIIKYFPSLTSISLRCVYYNVDPEYDLHILSSLKYLKEVRLVFQKCSNNALSTFLSTCPQVKTISFGPEGNSDLSFFLNEISRSCPLLNNLTINLFSVKILDFSYTFNETVEPETKPFQNLMHLIWPNAPLTYALYILRYATNIKIIEFLVEMHGSGILVTDEFLSSVLKDNPLTQLEKLRIDCPNSVSPEMTKYMIINCEKLTSLSVRDFNPNSHLLWSEVHTFIYKNNYEVHFDIITDTRCYYWKV